LLRPVVAPVTRVLLCACVSHVLQPFGWPSREFLRKLCIGKVVRFAVEYKKDTSAGPREFAAVYLADSAAPGGFSENMYGAFLLIDRLID
jgi:hypothetical protein